MKRTRKKLPQGSRHINPSPPGPCLRSYSEGLQWFQIHALVAALSIISAGAGAQTDPTQLIVDAFYPERLTPESAAARRSCYRVHSVTTEGQPSRIIAGYTDESRAALRVLDRTAAGTFQVSFDSPSEPFLVGATCQITLIDFDSDGQLDLFVEFASGRGSQGWVYRWQGNEPVQVTPTYTSEGHAFSSLGSPYFLDTLHDGTLQIISRGSDAPQQGTSRVATAHALYRLLAAGYSQDRRVLLADDYMPSSNPGLNVSTFYLVRGSTGPYRLRVINGDRLGQNRTSGGTITVNGTIVVTPSQLHDQVEFLEVALPGDLPDRNVLRVQLAGPSTVTVTIVVEDVSLVPGGLP
jgi:hypothetical protein